MPTATDEPQPSLHEVAWHSLEAEEAYRRLDVDPARGLSTEEAAARLEKYGPNEVSKRRGTPAWLKFLEQFNQALVYILLAATVVSMALGEWTEAGVIFGVVLVNAIVGFIQEQKAEKSIAALSAMVRSEATVRRDGHKARVSSRDLVPGDIVLLQSGDSVPADLRVTVSRGIQVEESALTGESAPVRKETEALESDTEVSDRTNSMYSGSLVTYGQAEGVVYSTGDDTEMGRIATMLAETVSLTTPLTRKIEEFSRLLVYVILGLSGLTFLLGVLRGEQSADMFMAAVALAVGAIPEGLPAAVTITLAIGVARMAKRNAIIRKLPAVETLGSTTVICSDKTGTLTENQMTVQQIWAGGKRYNVAGAGYEPTGDFQVDDETIDPQTQPALLECLRAGLLCNDSRLERKDERWQAEGDPTEAALIVSAWKAGLDSEAHERDHPRVDVIPFESEHMFMATLHDTPGGAAIYKKGSVERVLSRCHNALDAEGNPASFDEEDVRRAVDEMAAAGLRVLAFAKHDSPPESENLKHDHVSGELTFLGLQGMSDPPRPEAISAVAECQAAGLQVKMITGDHAGTAAAIAKQLGILDDTNEQAVTTGRELRDVSDEDMSQVAEDTAVFARVAPEQKLMLVRALQSRGHIVAMTGDGVNDAPALKQADIGVAMGIMGTDVSKGAADVILTDDNFASIEAAVEEGRNVFDNLTKFIAFTLPVNGGEAMLILAAIVLGIALPILPVQLLWINMTGSLLLGINLVFEPKEAGLMQRPPRSPDDPILGPKLIFRVILVSLLMAAGGFSAYYGEEGLGSSIDQMRTAVVNVIVMVEAFYLFNCRSLSRSIFDIGLFSNPQALAGVGLMMVSQLLFTYNPVMQGLFGSAALSWEIWPRIVGAGVVVFVIVEVVKKIESKYMS